MLTLRVLFDLLEGLSSYDISIREGDICFEGCLPRLRSKNPALTLSRTQIMRQQGVEAVVSILIFHHALPTIMGSDALVQLIHLVTALPVEWRIPEWPWKFEHDLACFLRSLHLTLIFQFSENQS